MVGLASSGKRNASRSYRAGSEYLNYQFGLAPLSRDVAKAVDAFRRSEQIWDQYAANSGKRLKRRYDFPEYLDVKHATLVNRPPMPNLGSRFLNTLTRPVYRTTTTKVRTWFEGCFTYYVPDNPFSRNLAKWEKLYGGVPDVETLWNLTPWSWAADWVGDLGTLASNANSFSKDGLVMLYGYVMEYLSIKVEYVMDGIYYDKVMYNNGVEISPGPHTLVQTLQTESKRRIKASPYGFTLDWDGFSPTQLAVLAALGVTRGKR
jgi:hypothetical protein